MSAWDDLAAAEQNVLATKAAVVVAQTAHRAAQLAAATLSIGTHVSVRDLAGTVTGYVVDVKCSVHYGRTERYLVAPDSDGKTCLDQAKWFHVEQLTVLEPVA